MMVRSGSFVNFKLDDDDDGNEFSGDLNDEAEAGDTDAMSDD